MASATTDATNGPQRRTWNVNPVAVTVGVSAAALMLSLFILQGQTTSRIDSARTEVQASINATRIELQASIDTVNERLDRVLLTLVAIVDVADDIEALRGDVAKLVE